MTQRYKPIENIGFMISNMKPEESVLDLEIVSFPSSVIKDDKENEISTMSDVKLHDDYEHYEELYQKYSSTMKDKGAKLIQYMEKIKTEMNRRKLLKKDTHGIGASTCQKNQLIDEHSMSEIRHPSNTVYSGSRMDSVLETGFQEVGFGNAREAFSLELELMKKKYCSTEIVPIFCGRDQELAGMQSRDSETLPLHSCQRSSKNLRLQDSDSELANERRAVGMKEACMEGNQILRVTSSKDVIGPLCPQSQSRTRRMAVTPVAETPLQPLRGRLLDCPSGDCSARKGSAQKRARMAIGGSPDTAMELSDDEERKQLKNSTCTALLTHFNNNARRQGLCSTVKWKEGVVIAYPSRSDPEAIEIRYSDLQHLAPFEFLNDTIIDFYIKYIQRPDYLDSGRRKIFHFFNSFFYKKLILGKRKSSDPFSKLRKWTKGINIFEKTYLLIPIHDSAHWSLAIICFQRTNIVHPHILHLDSMSSGHVSHHIFRVLKGYLEAEWKYTLNNSDTENQLPYATLKRVEVPLQENEWDCGLFLLYYIERFVQDAPLHFQSNDLERMFGRNWFEPRQASALRNIIQHLLENLFQAEIEDTSLSKRQIVQEVLMEDLD